MLIDEILDGRADVVIANPPYIVDPLAERREAIRKRYVSAHSKFGLGVPFTERLFQLAREGGWIAQITSNAFMKREHGRPLVEEVLPRWDLTHVIDTSGAFIPGHGTPTVILAARARAATAASIRAVMSKRGEPKTPDEGEPGLVWRAILAGLGAPGHNAPPRAYGVEGSRIVKDALALGRASGVEKRLKTRLGPALLGAALVFAFRARRWIAGESVVDGLDEIHATTGVDVPTVDLTESEDAEVFALLSRVAPPGGPSVPRLLDAQPAASWATTDTDWIGDLYQATHEGVVARDALCQTPWFVQDLLLWLALEPALDEIAPRDSEGHRPSFDRVRVLDPACGTGHLLCAAYRRLFDALMGSMEHTAYDAANLALRCVEGVELTPETAALARLRLVLAWADSTGYGLGHLAPGEVAADHYSLRDVCARVRVAVGNSLLDGCEGRRAPEPPAPVLAASTQRVQLALWEAAE